MNDTLYIFETLSSYSDFIKEKEGERAGHESLLRKETPEAFQPFSSVADTVTSGIYGQESLKGGEGAA